MEHQPRFGNYKHIPSEKVKYVLLAGEIIAMKYFDIDNIQIVQI